MAQRNVHSLRSTNLTYQEAVEALNNLQTNAAYIRQAPKHSAENTTLQDTHKFLVRSGITADQLNSLSVIHIAGTKGKGSTCSLVESILRSHGFRTGLYTSPHLITVRERIRINGSIISEEDFTKNFKKVYNELVTKKEHPDDMPPYFKFLTILMFHVFLSSPVDVVILEVGIGGEYDCTNVVQSPVCVGITALGLDHTSMLGDTLACIAWQKAGIFKAHVPAFTVSQPPEAMEILKMRAAEKNCTLTVVPQLNHYRWSKYPPDIGIIGAIQHENAALAVRLAETWMKVDDFNLKKVEEGLRSCKWPGRTQVLRGKLATYYLDGAHTTDSMRVCVHWFKEMQEHQENSPKILIFNSTGSRNNNKFLEILKDIDFDRAYFVPNISGKNCPDQDDRQSTSEKVLERCKFNCDLWGSGGFTGNNMFEVITEIERDFAKEKRIHVLITGSLHLVGAALAVLDPQLTMTTEF